MVRRHDRIRSSWFGVPGTRNDEYGKPHRTVLVVLAWRMSDLYLCYPYPNIPPKFDPEKPVHLKSLYSGHHVHHNHFYLSFLPAKINNVDPLLRYVHFPPGKLPLQYTDGKCSIHEKPLAWMLTMESQLKATLNALKGEACRHFPQAEHELTHWIDFPSRTEYYGLARTRDQTQGRYWAACCLIIILMAKVSFCVCMIMSDKDFAESPTRWETILRQQRDIHPCFVDDLKASFITDPNVLRIGGRFFCNANPPYNRPYEMFRDTASKWNIPFIIAFNHSSARAYREKLGLPYHAGDAMLPSEDVGRQVIDHTTYKHYSILKRLKDAEVHQTFEVRKLADAPLDHQFEYSDPFVHVDERVPTPPPTLPRKSQQIPLETPHDFVTRRFKIGRERSETPAGKNLRIQRLDTYKTHPRPNTKSNYPTYYLWEEDESGALVRLHLPRADAAIKYDDDCTKDWIYNEYDHTVDIYEGFNKETRELQTLPVIDEDYMPLPRSEGCLMSNQGICGEALPRNHAG